MRLENLLEELRATSKPSEKIDTLMKYKSKLLVGIIKATYDPFILFNVKIDISEVIAPGDYDISELEDEFNAVIRFCTNSASPKQNKEMIMVLVQKLNKGSQDLLIGTLNKNWRVGISSKSIIKLFPGLLKRFNVQLSNKYKKGHKPHVLPKWILSYKLDGLRCVALRDSNGWSMYSRTGKEFLTVEHLKPQLENLYINHGWTFFDGELYKHGLPFEEIQGPIMAFTKGQVENMDYHIFVAGDAEKFLLNIEPNHVDPVVEFEHPDAPNIYFVTKGEIKESDIYKSLEEAFDQGYEGIMLRDPSHLYDYKRSNTLLKLKSTDDEDNQQGETISDCIVIDIEYNDKFPVINDGVLTYKRLLNKLWVLQDNGVKCKVGSGYTLDFRNAYTDNPFDLIGKVVEIQHQNWGSNGRMRFPRLIKVREDL